MSEPGKRRWWNIPERINSIFGDEKHEVEEPKEVTSEKLNQELKESDQFDD